MLADLFPGASFDDQGRVLAFSESAIEYQALVAGSALTPISDRGLIEITGKDRTSWLQGLLTNHVANVEPGLGNYVFACNRHGRIMFDANMLVLADRIWLDVDGSVVALAMEHLRKFLIVEDVELVDRIDASQRIGVTANAASALFDQIGASHGDNVARLASFEVRLSSGALTTLRTDFHGDKAFELLVPTADFSGVWKEIVELTGATPVGATAVETRRIENGVPRFGLEITDQHVPAETRQLERAVAMNKGCYLGQEIVARMQSRNAVARLLVGVVLEGDELPEAGAVIMVDDTPAGEVTSACHSISRSAVVGMGYVKTDAAESGRHVEIRWGSTCSPATIEDLPLVPLPGSCEEPRP